jgi:tRNA nucleotidyltransferase (CCA-adding enzyme)
MDYKLPNEVTNVLNTFTKTDYQIYIVGGAVRDLLMGREVTDFDFTTDAKPEEILKLFPDGFYDNKFGTVGVPIGIYESREPRASTDPHNIFEITTMRKEGLYKDHRHPIEVGWTNKIDEDLARRDFTINAIALSADGKFIDPYDGQKDIKNKLIRAVGDPTQRFQEDALRLMRAIRISTQLDFEIEEKTLKAIEENAKLIEEIAPDRIREELFKILGSENPLIGIIKLRETGILQIILPELERCFGIVQEGPKHDRIYDIGEHSLLSLKFAPSESPLVRLAALLHDVGKPDTFVTENGNVTFYNHDIVGGRVVLKIAKRLNLSKKQTDKLYSLVRWHMFTVDENQTDSAIRRFIKNVGKTNIEDIMAVRVGDRLGGGTTTETSWRIEKFKERIKQVLHKPFSITDLKVNGKDIMETLNIKPGRQVGEILEKLFKEVLEDSSKNNREYLLGRIKEIQ